MADSLESRLDQLEILYSEQDSIIESLNAVMARQTQEISRLKLDLEQVEAQLQRIKSDFAGNADPTHDKPPHY